MPLSPLTGISIHIILKTNLNSDNHQYRSTYAINRKFTSIFNSGNIQFCCTLLHFECGQCKFVELLVLVVVVHW